MHCVLYFTEMPNMGKNLANFGNLLKLFVCVLGGGLRVKIGHHKIGECAKIKQNWIWGRWRVEKTQKTSDIIYVHSLILFLIRGSDELSSIFKFNSIYHRGT